MKTYQFFTILITVCSILNTQAQNEVEHTDNIQLDTLYANEKKSVALFFPSAIQQGVTGTENYIFTYNRDKEQYLGLLQAKRGEESNLLVVNTDGSVYSFILKYKEKLDQLNYFISKTQSIGNQIPSIKQAPFQEKSVQKFTDALYYPRFCAYLMKQERRTIGVRNQSYGIKLQVKNIIFENNELYFVIEIENKSSLDYNVNFLDFYVETRKKGKKKSLQKLLKSPIYTYHMPQKIREGQTHQLVYVLPKFSLANDKRLKVELHEKYGERNVQLKIKNKHINNPD